MRRCLCHIRLRGRTAPRRFLVSLRALHRIRPWPTAKPNKAKQNICPYSLISPEIFRLSPLTCQEWYHIELSRATRFQVANCKAVSWYCCIDLAIDRRVHRRSRAGRVDFEIRETSLSRRGGLDAGSMATWLWHESRALCLPLSASMTVMPPARRRR